MKRKYTRPMVTSFLAAIVVSLAVLCCSSQEDSLNAASDRAPHFTLQDVRGNTLRLNDLRGKVVLLNFFATWCAPCIQETPDFVRLHGKFKAQGFEIVGIGMDMEGAAALAPFVKRFAIPYPILVGTRKVVVDYGEIKGVPTSFFIDRQGYIVDSFIGVRPAHMLEKTITRL